MDSSVLIVTINGLTLLGVVWKGATMTTELRKDMKFQTEITERIVQRLDWMDARQNSADIRIAQLEGQSRGAR